MKRIAKTIGIFELNQKYSTDHKARIYFEELRWGKKPVCVRCGGFKKITEQKKTSRPLLVRRLPEILHGIHEHPS